MLLHRVILRPLALCPVLSCHYCFDPSSSWSHGYQSQPISKCSVQSCSRFYGDAAETPAMLEVLWILYLSQEVKTSINEIMVIMKG